MKKQLISFFTLLFVLTFLQPLNAATTPSAALEMKIKKIVMMMNIVAKEYFEGIREGEIINAAEYEESQVFLDQAIQRFHSLPDPTENPEAREAISQRLEKLRENVHAKVDPGEVRSAINAIKSDLLNNYGIKIVQAPTTPVSLENGKRIFKANCAVCHGQEGKGDGPLASQLDPKPAVLADPAITGDEATNPYDNFQVINVGIANTAMVGWADILPPSDLWDVTYHIRTFTNKNLKLPQVSPGSGETGSERIAKTFSEIRSLLDQSIGAFRENQTNQAAELASDAYLTFEQVESGLVSKRKSLGLRLESAFSRLTAEIKRQAPLGHVERILSEIKSDLVQAEEILQEKVGFTGLFIQSFSIIVREGFEAILIIAALITFLVKSRNEDKLKSIYIGVGVGILGSFLTAYILHEILNISMGKQELLEGWIMLVAVAVLFWVSYWLVSKIEAEKWQQYITAKMRQAITAGSAFTLGAVAFLSVYREGFETVLFYKALYLYAGSGTAGIVPGFLAGCLVLAVIYFLISQVGVRVPIKWFFAFTSVFLYYMAFTFMGKGLHELQMGGSLSMTGADFVPEISWLGIYPTWETFIGQGILVLAYVAALVYTFGIKPEVATKQLKDETSHIKSNISTVHHLVEHISHHAKRCEIFLKDTRDQDLKELSEHLKEIHTKVHELSDHVRYVENQIADEYERLGRPFMSKEEKGLT